MKKKILGIALLVLFTAGMVSGYMIWHQAKSISDSLTVIYSEKVAYCNDGTCDISSLKYFEDGGMSGSSANGVSQEWVTEWLSSK